MAQKNLSEEKTKQKIVKEVTEVKQLEAELTVLENTLSQSPEFRNFISMQKQFREKSEAVWKDVEEKMIENNIKSVKGEWGSLTIAERQGWDTTEELPTRFTKKVPDTKKLTDHYKLTGKVPKGATPKITKYLTKRFK